MYSMNQGQDTVGGRTKVRVSALEVSGNAKAFTVNFTDEKSGFM